MNHPKWQKWLDDKQMNARPDPAPCEPPKWEWETAEAQISMPSGGDKREIKIEVKLADRRRIRVIMSPEDFAFAVFGRAGIPCEFGTIDYGKDGKE